MISGELDGILGYDSKKIFNKLVSEKITINDLDIDNDAHKKAFMMYLQTRTNSILKSLKSENEKKFLAYAIKENYKLFVNLEQDQYNEDSASFFICESLKEKNDNKNDRLRIKKSYDKKILLIANYQTNEGEQISYYDKSLEIPASLMTSITIYFKIKKTIKFLELIDCDICEFGPHYVSEKLSYFISESINYAILSALETNGYNYYELVNHKESIREEFIKKMYSFIDKEALEINQVSLNNIDFVQEIADKLQKISFDNKLKREQLANEIRYEKESLELYEKKVEIHGKNPGVEWNLSEAEKDKALERYLIKNDIPLKKNNVEVDNKILNKKEKAKEDAVIQESKDSLPNVTKRPIVLPIITLSLVFIAFFISFITFLNSSSTASIIIIACFELLAIVSLFIGKHKNSLPAFKIPTLILSILTIIFTAIKMNQIGVTIFALTTEVLLVVTEIIRFSNKKKNK